MQEPSIGLLSFSKEMSIGLYVDDVDKVNASCHIVIATAKPGRMTYMAQLSDKVHVLYTLVSPTIGTPLDI